MLVLNDSSQHLDTETDERQQIYDSWQPRHWTTKKKKQTWREAKMHTTTVFLTWRWLAQRHGINCIYIYIQCQSIEVYNMHRWQLMDSISRTRSNCKETVHDVDRSVCTDDNWVTDSISQTCTHTQTHMQAGWQLARHWVLKTWT